MDNSETHRVVPAIDRNESAYTPPAPPTSHMAQAEIDDSKTSAVYANFCRLSGTPEELLIDFGLNPQPLRITAQSIAVKHRVVTGWHTAKRLLKVLQMTVERHEAAFGVLETDVQKRAGRPPEGGA